MSKSAVKTAPDDIPAIMSRIVGSLLPVVSKDADPALWLVYDELQQWALCVSRKVPQIDPTQTLAAAHQIIGHLAELHDRKLAGDISRVIRMHTRL